jgi:CheY-like chemotaxis protein/anti-anti-sigma regulatory factor
MVDAPTPKAPGSGQRAIPVGSLRPLRIVIVDDVEPIRRLLRAVLADAGHTVVGEASDGCAGLREARERSPDVVIMDWSMPGMDGVAATREIVAICAQVAVIAFSSAGDPAVRDAFLASGALAYVNKGDIDGLLDALRDLGPRPLAYTSRPPGPATRTPPASAEPTTLHVRHWPALARADIAIRGVLDGGAQAALAAAVGDHSRPGSVIVLDLSEVTAIDEEGVQAIDHSRQLAGTAQAQLEIQDPSPAARRALRRRTWRS